MKHPYFFLTVLFFLYSCGNSRPAQFSSDSAVLNKQMIQDAKAGIQSGDVIMRSGRDFTSYRIRELSDKDKTYSHAGIALVTDSNVLIYHITPPDLDEPKSDTVMRLETLDQFANPARCFGFGIVRYQLSKGETDSAMYYLDSLKKSKTTFDYRFDLLDGKKMYCSEMVDNTMRYATSNRISLERKYFTKLQAKKAARYFHSTMEEVNKRAYISIDNLQLNPHCAIIYNYLFLK